MNTITINAETEPLNPEKIARECVEQYDETQKSFSIYFLHGGTEVAKISQFQSFTHDSIRLFFFEATDLRGQIIEVGLLLAKAFDNCELRIKQ
jgi:hypothetical protein